MQILLSMSRVYDVTVDVSMGVSVGEARMKKKGRRNCHIVRKVRHGLD